MNYEEIAEKCRVYCNKSDTLLCRNIIIMEKLDSYTIGLAPVTAVKR